MTELEFNPIIDKLRITYGDKYYLDLRTEFIWQAVHDMRASWFDSIVNLWIGSNTKPLMVNDIRDAALKEKSRELNAKILSPQKYQPLTSSVFDESDIKMMFGMIRRKMNYEVSDMEWKSFNEWVENAAKQSKQVL